MKKTKKKQAPKAKKGSNGKGPSQSSRKRLKSLLFMGIGTVAFLLVIGIFNKEGVTKVLESGKEVQVLKTNISRLKKENQVLIGKIDSLKNNPRYLEKIAREDLGLALPGETIFVFPDS